MDTARHGAWCNTVVDADDKEVAAIDRMEHELDELPGEVVKVRELITRFEICHFKVKGHYRNILLSIAELRPIVAVDTIGEHHPHQEGEGWKHDTTGRSIVGMRYILALQAWLGDTSSPDVVESVNNGKASTTTTEMRVRIASWLGKHEKDKERLVRLLLGRLDYGRIDDYFPAGEPNPLELQVLSTDICHYTFPEIMDQVIQAIGRMESSPSFQGCGSTNEELTAWARDEVERLSAWLVPDGSRDDLDVGERTPVKVWLTACLAKTLKQHVQLDEPLPALRH